MSEQGSRFEEDPGLHLERSRVPQPPLDDILAKVERFASSDRFANLPTVLREIAITRAVEVLGLSEEDLLLEAGEIDARAITDPFSHYERELNGSILDNYQKFRLQMLHDGNMFATVEQAAMRRLRVSIASRSVREKLARKLGYKPGQAEAITLREDFQAANDLTWQAVREFCSQN